MRKLFILFSVIALAACGGSDDVEPTSRDVPSPRLLTVEVSENPMQDESASAREITRTAAATTTATLSGFTMHYEDGWSKNFTKTGDTWSTAIWPTTVGNNEKIDFYAHDGGTFNWNSGNPYVTFTTEENVANLKDFLVATHKSISYNDNGGKVSLAFDHACAAVQFYVYKTEDADYTVSSIILRNVKNSGYYYYNNAEDARWVLGETTTYYTLTTNVEPFAVSTTPKRLDCGWLYLIPNSKAGIQIEINYNTDKQKTLTLTGTWEAGKQYTVNIRIGKAS